MQMRRLECNVFGKSRKEEPQIPPRLLQPAVTERDEAVLADAFPEKLPAKLKTMTLVDLIEHFVRTERSK